MADDSFAGEKTEPASPRKRQEAREKGQVAKSQDLNTATLLLAAFLLLFLLGGYLTKELMGLELLFLESLGAQRIDTMTVNLWCREVPMFLLKLLSPVVGVLFLVAVASNLMQVGFMMSGKPVSPDPNRLNPIKGLQRIFSKRGMMRLLFGLLKLGTVAVVLVYALRDLVQPATERNLLGLLHTSMWDAFDFTHQALFSVGAKAAVTLLVLALLDYGFQRWQHEQDLMMTKQEVREEMKRMEGDPKLKEQRRRMQQRLALQRMMHDIPQADVVITNPTHVSCAVQYDESKMAAPKLLAKGKGSTAHRIREKAIEHGVPVVQEPPLARLIYESAEVGQEIPPDLYKPVAEVLAYVYRMNRQRGRAG